MSHGGNTVRLRPSLRAAAQLEALHGDLEALFRKLDQFDTGTIAAVITTAARERGEADALMTALAQAPLRDRMTATHRPVIDLCRLLIPEAPQDAPQRSQPAKSAARPWSEVYRELYRIATGWLGWSPSEAWNATPTEIAQAFETHLDKLKAIHGSAEEDGNSTPASSPSPEQQAANIAAGLDPEFDRAGLHALKARITGKL